MFNKYKTKKDWHKRSRLYKFFIQDDTKIKLESKTSFFYDENDKLIVHREFYTFRALYTHFWYTLVVNPIKDLKQGIVTPELALGLRFALIVGVLINLKNNILVHNLVLVGGAIAYDATSYGNISNAVLTVSHTCTGSNRVLAVNIAEADGTNLSSVTYNGVSMTQQFFNNNSNMYLYGYTLVAPATGANNMVVTWATSKRQLAGCVSFSGAAQTSIIDGSQIRTNVWNPTLTVTTSYDNTFLFDIVGASSGINEVQTAGQVLRFGSVAISGSSYTSAGSTKPTTTAGSNTTSWKNGDKSMNTLIYGIREYVFVSNIKSYNTNLKANIKTINTNPIANVKSLNTNI